jgi:hypothetical protein
VIYKQGVSAAHEHLKTERIFRFSASGRFITLSEFEPAAKLAFSARSMEASGLMNLEWRSSDPETGSLSELHRFWQLDGSMDICVTNQSQGSSIVARLIIAIAV